MKRIMIISAKFSPCSSVGAKRPTFLARNLPVFGWEPYVLSMKRRCFGPIDPSADYDWLETVKRLEVACGSPWWHARMLRRSENSLIRTLGIPLAMFDRFTGGMCPLDVCYTWFLRAAKPGQEFAEKEGIDLLWATAPPYSALYLAYLIHEKTGIPYVVDYRDARVTSIDHTSRREQRDWEYENRAAALSAGYTYVAPDQKGVLERTVPSLRDKPSILAHNWIEQDKLDRCPPKQWRNHTVVHGGTVYGGTRRMDGIARAVTALAGETGLRLENYGPMVDHKFLKSITDEAGESGHVNLNAPLPYSEFISACKGAAILLLLIAEDSHRRQHAGAIPGKLYDYLGCHRPILVVGPEGCEAGRMVEVMRRGIACVPDDYTGITVAMSKLLREEGRDGPLDLRPAAVADYQSGNVVAKMDGFFNSIVKGDEK